MLSEINDLKMKQANVDERIAYNYKKLKSNDQDDYKKDIHKINQSIQ